jgi:hypothetical protein
LKITAKGLTAAALLAGVAAFAAQDSVNLTWKPTAGQKSKHKLEVTAALEFGGNKTDMAFGMTMASEVVKIDSGKVTVKTKASNLTLMVGGQDMSQMMGDQSFDTTVTYTANGEPVDIQSDNPSGAETQARMEAAYAFYYPNKEMKVGDTWTRTVKGDSTKGTVDGEATYKLEAIETIGKWKTAKVSFNYAEKKGEAPMSATGSIWVEIADGSLTKGEYAMKNVQFDPTMPPTNATAKVTRIE